MGIIGKQFGAPSGALGRVAALFVARNNADFNRAVVDEISAHVSKPAVVAELGYGPGVGLAALLEAFPEAMVLGADPSAAVMGQAMTRNRAAVRSGRLRLLEGDARELQPYAPVDLVVAVHVLYFWHDPVDALVEIRDLLTSGGHVAIGYQLKQHMPRPAQRDFPREGHVLYESDDDVKDVLNRAGIQPQKAAVVGPASSPSGRIMLGRRVEPQH